MDTYSIQTLVPHLLLLHLEMVFLVHLMHLLHMSHLRMALMTLVHGCLVIMLVMPAKDLVSMVEEMMMKMMVSSRSPIKALLWPLLW